MGKQVNLNLTDNEKLARNIVGLETDALHFRMGDEQSLNQMISRQKAETFNTHVAESSPEVAASCALKTWL